MSESRMMVESKTLTEEKALESEIAILLDRMQFATMLWNYVPRRPASYADRKWLEGYCAAASNLIPYLPKNLSAQYCADLIRAYTIFEINWTARTRGIVDAFLDSVGC